MRSASGSRYWLVMSTFDQPSRTCSTNPGKQPASVKSKSVFGLEGTPISTRNNWLVHVSCHPPRQPVFFPWPQAIQLRGMNGLAVHAQEQHCEVHVLCVTYAVLIPCRMIEHDEGAGIASQRPKH